MGELPRPGLNLESHLTANLQFPPVNFSFASALDHPGSELSFRSAFELASFALVAAGTGVPPILCSR